MTGTATAPPNSVTAALTGGLVSFGDSNTYGEGYQPSYPSALHSASFPSGSSFANYGVPGYQCWQQAQTIFTYASPGDSGNPVTTDMIGTNDLDFVLGDGGPLYFTQCQMSANAYAAMSSSYKVAASSSLVTASGQWEPDTTYSNFVGMVSDQASSCLSLSHDAPEGLIYVWYEKEYVSGGTLNVLIDGSPAVDSITSTASLETAIPIFFTFTGETYPAMARFVTSPGIHTVAACVTSSSGAGNDVHVYGFGYPPANPPTSATAPVVYLGGVMAYQNDPTDATYPGLGVANSLNRQTAAALAADGLNVQFVDVRSFVDPVLGMLGAHDADCLASWQPGFHVNNCGTYELQSAFWQAINGSFSPL